MVEPRQKISIGVAGILLILLAVLSACIPGRDEASAVTATPRRTGTVFNLTATPNMANFRVLPTPRVCSAVILKSIKTNMGQGNLFAWSPDGSKLAYIVPTEAHQWFAGSLMVAAGPDFANPVMLAQNVAGGLTWSPDGDKLAFSVLRVSEGIYTIMSVDVDGSGLKDLFPGQVARMDNFTSPKVITGWTVPDRLSVLAECGASCLKTYLVDPYTAQIQQQTDAGQVDATRVWRPDRLEKNFDPASYPAMIDPNLSPDGTRLVYFDANGYLWVLLVDEKQAFMVNIENYTPIFVNQEGNRETHWSPDNRLAVRIDDHLEIYDVPCTP